ncbi:MAG: hypothetical protein KHX46_10345 [Clostridiales bacterium]|nr:hypothetical protein [Clostridiales bacterium]
MTRLLSWMKRRKGLFLVLILAVLLAGGLFLPRRLSRLCLESSVENLTSVEVYCPPNGGEGEFEEYHITQPEELEALKTLLHLGYARPKLFHVDYVNGGFAGYDFVFYENSVYNGNRVYLFTEDILVINNRQYVLYSRDFAEQLRRLLKE